MRSFSPQKIRKVLITLSSIMGLFGAFYVYEKAREDLVRRLGFVANSYFEKIHQSDANLKLISELSTTSASLRFQSQNAVEQVLIQITQNDSSVHEILITDSTGHLFSRAGKKTEGKDFYRIYSGLAKSDEFLQLQVNSNPSDKTTFLFVGDYQERYLILRRPIFDNSENIGYVVAFFPSSSILDALKVFYNLDDKLLLVPDSISTNSIMFSDSNTRLNLACSIETSFVFRNIFSNFFSILFLVIFGVLSLYFIVHLLIKKLVVPFALLMNKIAALTSGDYNELTADSFPRLFRPFIKDINELVNTLRETNSEREKLAVTEAKIQVHLQVAHDIRSPLSALDMIIRSTKALPEQERLLIRSATARIHDIANNLLRKENNEKDRSISPAGISLSQEKRESHLLSTVVESIITEKRMQFRDEIGITIELIHSPESYGLFSLINLPDFKRVLSNVLNNAVEALDGKGSVVVTLRNHYGNAEIEIRDSGKGIPPEILSQLGHGVNSFGKPGGSGLGLFHARSTLEKWGGKITLASVIGKGTSAFLELPLSLQPRWFLKELRTGGARPIVIVDDDISIHQVWKQRFGNLDSPINSSILHSFSSPDKFEEWFRSVPQGSLDKALFLIDYEYIGSNTNGLDLVEKLGIADRAKLVTSRFEEKGVFTRCESVGICMIPKTMSSFIPIIDGGN